jgi:hypothetical protein
MKTNLVFCLFLASCAALTPPTTPQLAACANLETAAVQAGSLSPATATADLATLKAGNLPAFCSGKV